MIIKAWNNGRNREPMTLGIPVGTMVEILLFPGDIPTIEPHNDRKNQHNVRSFDVVIDSNGDFRCDWVNVTKVANSTVGEAVYGQKQGP